MNETVFIVDDEQDIVELVSINLKKSGYFPKGFGDSKAFFRALKSKTPNLVILDVMLPDMDGLEICKQLKKDDKYSAIPVIMLTAKADESYKLVGLELGADDYVTKPFSIKELIARVKAVLRRNEGKLSGKTVDVAGKLKISPENYTVEVEGKKVELTMTEFKILHLLASGKGKVFTRDSLLDNLWGDEKIVIDRTIDVHIRHLREKLGKAGSLTKNIRGIGYKLEG